MYRILIADDERIVTETIRNIILKDYPGKFEVAVARSGLAAVEQARLFAPDIVYMDIHMPDIDGLQALKEIRRLNSSTLFYIVSACDKFEYAAEAIPMGVEYYLTKPFTREKLVEMTRDAIEKVDEQRKKQSDAEKIQEKLNAVIPVAENWFVSSIIFQSEWNYDDYFLSLLDLTEKNGYVFIIQLDNDEKKRTGNNGSGDDDRRNRELYKELRTIVKSYLSCYIGNINSDQISAVVPFKGNEAGVEERLQIIELMERLAAGLKESLQLNVRIGVGRVRPLEELRVSYHDAGIALQLSQSGIVHINDVSAAGANDEGFPTETENRMLKMMEHGDVEGMRSAGILFFDWIIRTCHQDSDNIRMKILEYVIWAERAVFHESGMSSGFELSENYLKEVKQLHDIDAFRNWFLNKLEEACSRNRRREEPLETVVSKAMEYIAENYRKDITLEDVAKLVNVSPYYFSKLFKEEAGENFIEFLTRVRIDKAIILLEDRNKSIKEISLEAGYSDPNYFSRLFKKRTGMTPREYRKRE